MAQMFEKRRSMIAEMTPTAVNNRASTRFSTYSTAPTLAPSIAPSHLSTSSETPSEKASPLAQDIRTLNSGLARLDQPKLQSQRYALSDAKKEDMGKLALGAKLDRALGRRMVGQDASFTHGRSASMGGAAAEQREKPRHVDVMEFASAQRGMGGESKEIAV